MGQLEENETYQGVIETVLAKVRGAHDASARHAIAQEVARLCHSASGFSAYALLALRRDVHQEARVSTNYFLIRTIYEAHARFKDAAATLIDELALGRTSDDFLSHFERVARHLAARPREHGALRALLQAYQAYDANNPLVAQFQRELDALTASWGHEAEKAREQAKAFRGGDVVMAADKLTLASEYVWFYGQDSTTALSLVDEAQQYYPGHRPSLLLLEEIAIALERPSLLMQRMESYRAAATRVESAVALWTFTTHFELVYGDASRAIEGWRRVAYLDAGNPQAVCSLFEYHADRQEWDKAIAMLAQWLDKLAVGQDSAAMVEATRVILAALGQVLRAQPDNDAGVALLERLYALRLNASPVLHQHAHAMLFECYRVSGRYAKAIELMRTEMTSLTDQAARSEMHRSIANLYKSQLNDHEAAYAEIERAFLESPLDPVVLQELETFAAEALAWESLANAYRTVLSVASDAKAFRPLLERLAVVLDERLHRGDEAIDCYQRLSASAELTANAQGALERLLRDNEKFGELAQLLEKKLTGLPLHDHVGRVAILKELAPLTLYRLNDVHGALGYYNAWTELDGANLIALRGLEDALSRTDNSPAQRRVLTTLVELGSSNEAWTDDQLKLAKLALLANDYADALRGYRAILLKHKDHRDAIDGLARMLDASASNDIKLEIAQILEATFASQQEHPRLAKVLEHRLVLTSDTQERKALMRRLGDLYENRLTDKTRAFELARQAFHEDPVDLAVRMWIEKLATDATMQARLAQAYEEEAQRASPVLAAQFQRRRADIYDEKLNDRKAATAAYQAVLQFDENDEKALSALEAIYRDTSDARALSALLVHRFEQAKSPERKRAYAFESATLYVDALGDAKTAATILRRLLESQADDDEARTKLERILRASNDFSALIQFYTEEEARLRTQRGAETDKRRLDVIAYRGEILEDAVHDTSQAVAMFAAVLDEDPTHALTLTYLHKQAALGRLQYTNLLEALYRRLPDWHAYIELLGQKLTHVFETAEKRDIYLEMASVSVQHLDDAKRATVFYQQALRYDPSDTRVLQALETLFESRSMWTNLVDILERRLEVTDDVHVKSRILERLASVWAIHLSDAAAASRCHQKILEIDPDHPLSLRAMQNLYADAADYPALAENLARQATVMVEPAEQIRIHATAGKLFAEELHDKDASIASWQRVLEFDPKHREANVALQVLLTQCEQWERLSSLYQRQLKQNPDARSRLEINRRLAVVVGEKLHRREEAFHYWSTVLAVEPHNIDALRAVTEFHFERAEWIEFADHARRVIPLVEPHHAKEWRFHLAHVLARHLDEPDEAVRLGREYRALEPHTPTKLIEFGDLLMTLKAFRDAAEMYERAADLEAMPALKIELYRKAAQTCRDHLQQPLEAQHAWQSLLEVDRRDDEAFRELAHIYRSTAEWRRLVSLNESFLPYADASLRQELLAEIRALLEVRLGEKELAFISSCRLLKEDPLSVEALENAVRLAKETNSTEELTAVLEDEVENIQAVTDKVELYRRIAELHTVELSNRDEAGRIHERILDLVPNEQSSLDALIALAASEERYDKQIGWLERKLTQLLDPGARQAVLFELAALWEERIEDEERAASLLQRVLEINADSDAALDGLIRLYRALPRWPELVNILIRKVELATDPNEATTHRMHIATVLEGEIRDYDAAIEWYAQIVAVDPAHTQSFEALERLYTALHRFSELIHLYEKKCEESTNVATKIALLSKMGALFETKFDSRRDACATYEAVLKLDANHVATIKKLKRLLHLNADWERLLQLLEHFITITSEAPLASDLLREKGDIHYQRLERIDAAEKAYVQAVALDARNWQAWRSLGLIYERSGNWFDAIDAMHKEIDARGSGPELAATWTRVGFIHDEPLADASAAKAAYERALALDPQSMQALNPLKRLAKHAQDWRAYRNYLLALLENATDTDEKVELLVEAGQFYEAQENDDESASHYYSRALEASPRHPDASLALAEIFFRKEAWQEAFNLFVVVLANTDRGTHPKLHCQQSFRLGYLAEKLGNHAASLDFYRQAFDTDPTYLPALEALGLALMTLQEWDEAQRVFETVLFHHRDFLTESEVVDVTAKLGEICLHQGQSKTALSHFERALQIDANHVPSLKATAEILQTMHEWTRAAAHLERLGDLASSGDRIDALWRLYEIARDELHSLPKCVEALERIRALGSPSFKVLDSLAASLEALDQNERAIEVLEEAAAHADDVNLAASLHYRIAEIYRGAIKNEPLALQKYNQTLDLVPAHVEAFAAIERMLVDHKQWRLLESNYLAMLERAKQLSAQVRLVLWRSIADLYRHALHDIDAAITAYELISKLDPGKREDAEILADLYAQRPDSRDKAIDVQHAIVQASDNPTESARRLYALYQSANTMDAVYAICSTLLALGTNNADEKRIAQYLERGVPARATNSLLHDHWQMILHPDMHKPIALLAKAVSGCGLENLILDLKDADLRKKDQVDLQESELYVANIVRYAAKLLGTSGVELYRRPNSAEGVAVLNTEPRALVVGDKSDLLVDAPQRLLLFHVGRNLAYARADMVLARVFPPEELRVMLLGLCSVFNRALQHNASSDQVVVWAKAFASLPSPLLSRLKPLCQEAATGLTSTDGLLDYYAACEFSATRAGLVASCDISAVLRGIKDTGIEVGLPERLRLKDAVLFSLSKPYVQLRKVIGAAITVQPDALPPTG